MNLSESTILIAVSVGPFMVPFTRCLAARPPVRSAERALAFHEDFMQSTSGLDQMARWHQSRVNTSSRHTRDGGYW